MSARAGGHTGLYRGAAGIAGALVFWEVFARSGLFSQALTPPLDRILTVTWRILLDGTLINHAATTLGRVLLSLFLATLIAVPLGMAMGRMRRVERFFMPLVSVLMPIPSLALVPLFVLWLGIGNVTTITVVTYAACFPILYNVWTGVRAVNPLWVRAAASMGAPDRALFWRVVLPGASPYVFTGIRLSFGRAWIAVIGAELLASPQWGLGRLIFDAKEFLNSETMIAALITIGVIGIFFERLIFQTIEARTILRWGMSTSARD